MIKMRQLENGMVVLRNKSWTVVIKENPASFHVGFSFCCPKDDFSKEIGQQIAIGRVACKKRKPKHRLVVSKKKVKTRQGVLLIMNKYITDFYLN